jgi:hypothetical protein
MPQRVTGLLYAFMGLAAVAGLFLLGLNVYRAAGKGPRWKRRLLGAGLAMLAALGLVSCADEAKPGGGTPGTGGGTTTTPAGTRSLEGSKEWKLVLEAWTFCAPLATSGKSTTRQRKGADAKLKAAGKAVESLAAADLLVAAEAGLLKAEIAKIRADIYCNPPTDSQVTCYKMAFVSPAQKSLKRLNKRLPLLEKLVAGKKLHAPALKKVLASIEKDVAVLSSQKQLSKLPAAERSKAAKTRDAVKVALEKLKALLKDK